MAEITYRGPEKQVTWGGKVMKQGEAVEVANEDVLRKSVGNPFFEVSGYEPKPVKTTTTTVENPNIDPKNQARLAEGENTNRPSGIGTDEPLVVEQPAELSTVYPDTRNKAPTGGTGVGTGIRVDPESFKAAADGVPTPQQRADAPERRGPGRPPARR